MQPRRVTRALGVPLVTAVVLLAAGCGYGTSNGTTASESVTPTVTPAEPSTGPPATVEGLEDEVPPMGADFPASIADDGGEARPGESGDAAGDMVITGVRLLPGEGYDRLIVDLNTDGIPFWTARYSGSSIAAGEVVEVAGDSFLRLGLFTQASSAEPVATVIGDGSAVAEVRTTGSVAGYQEVLIGLRGGPAPFRTFGLTDPGRIVVDIRPAG